MFGVVQFCFSLKANCCSLLFQWDVIFGIFVFSFQTKVIETTKLSNYNAVVVEVSGNAYYCGTASFSQEKEDVLSSGFLLS